MNSTDGLRRFVKEKSSATGTGGGRRKRIASGKDRLKSESTAFSKCAKCGMMKGLHHSVYGLVPDHEFVAKEASDGK
jgi:hypothetical protein